MENYTSNQLRGKEYGYRSVFLSDRRFYDDKNFPNFFHRSGDFTIKEADVLMATGYVMTQLKNGEMKPQSPEHKHFLEVINGKQVAESLEEKTYLKYLKLIQRKDKIFSLGKNKISNVPFFEDNDRFNGSKGY